MLRKVKVDVSILLLPTASEGWGKVMFSHVSVHPSIHPSVCLSVHTLTQTGYTAIGMPLEFTQEDFLVFTLFLKLKLHKKNQRALIKTYNKHRGEVIWQRLVYIYLTILKYNVRWTFSQSETLKRCKLKSTLFSSSAFSRRQRWASSICNPPISSMYAFLYVPKHRSQSRFSVFR